MRRFVTLAAALLAAATLAQAEDPVIDIVNTGVVLPKIIVKDSSKLSDEALARSFRNILINDLRVSSNFEVISAGDERANYVLDYTLAKNGSTLSLTVKISLGGTERTSAKYSQQGVELYPFLAHRAVKGSVNALGLSPVNWMDHKILIARNTGAKKSQIILADYTLTYQRVVISGGLNLFPKWGNAAQSLFYYTSYDNDTPVLYAFNLNTNKATRILAGPGMLVASDVSEDGGALLLTMAPKDQPDLYLYELATKKLTQLTNYSGIDVNANFIGSQTGQGGGGGGRIVFVSDRLGYPNIFMQDLATGQAEQVVFHGRNNSAVSTYKDFLVYSSREEDEAGVFNLYLMSINSDYIRQLTANGKNIFPRFSSDGGSVVFIKYLGNQSALGLVRVNANKSFYFPLKLGKIQSIDW